MASKIKVFAGNYDKKEFYSYMGEVFALKEFRKELPYLCNEPGRVWFLAFEGKQLIGFASFQETRTKIVFQNDYVFLKHRGKGVYKQLMDYRLQHIKGKNKPIEVICNCLKIAEAYIKHGFKETKKTKNYIFMRKDGCHE